MKRITLILLGTLASLCSYGQFWATVTGTNDIINTNTGAVKIRQDIINPAQATGIGALFSWASASHTTGTASRVWGAYLLSLNHKSGTLNECMGLNATAGNESSGNGIINNAYGVWTRVQAGAGRVANGYGVYIFNTAATNDFGIYQAGVDDDNFFAGNVGVGTTLASNPNGYKLAVNGKIGAKEVHVENTSTTWADYVFEPTYKLMPLSEVELFVKLNKHLPEIPSADEVKAEGHKLGEMDVLLLKKVEEITLYLFEMKKQSEALQKQIDDLKAENKKLLETLKGQ